MHTVAPSLFWCIDLWNYVDARRKTVLGCSVMLCCWVQRESG